MLPQAESNGLSGATIILSIAYSNFSNCSNRYFQSLRSNKRFFDRKLEAETPEHIESVRGPLDRHASAEGLFENNGKQRHMCVRPQFWRWKQGFSIVEQIEGPFGPVPKSDQEQRCPSSLSPGGSNDMAH